ncbi:MAG TPA: hypothetical protein VK356_05745, partial [Thermomicrobiales bacterium]|nr:hypothetical protein [Thermomicrobiales bacterium]
QVGEGHLTVPEARLSPGGLDDTGFGFGFSGDDAHGLLRDDDSAGRTTANLESSLAAPSPGQRDVVTKSD